MKTKEWTGIAGAIHDGLTGANASGELESFLVMGQTKDKQVFYLSGGGRKEVLVLLLNVLSDEQARKCIGEAFELIQQQQPQKPEKIGDVIKRLFKP